MTQYRGLDVGINIANDVIFQQRNIIDSDSNI